MENQLPQKMLSNKPPLLATLTLILVGCTPMAYPPGAKTNEPYFNQHFYKTEDGAVLPLKQWLPGSEPKAVIIALHGFNDYSNFFDRPANYLSEQGIASFAYDQRGFGGSPKRGSWPGITAYHNDLLSFVQLVRHRFPQQPIFLLGESMGGAIVITAMRQTIPEVAGIILVAPALWARQTMPWYQTSLLWTLAHTVPRLTLTGRSVGVQASDNIDMLRELGRDPLVIKATRVEAIYGLTDLMDAAFNSATELNAKTLLMYGEKDEIIPKKATHAFLQRFLSVPGETKTVAFYQHGYHMLLRDMQADKIWQDIVAWINFESAPLPSGADCRANEILKSYK